MARRSYLDGIGGLWDRNIVGGGDVAFYCAVVDNHETWNRYRDRHNKQNPLFAGQFNEWVQHATMARNGLPATNLESEAIHLYHGSRENRQYVSRERIMIDHKFDPYKHIRITASGLLEWTQNAPEGLKRDVRAYFEGRREDE